MKKQPPSRLSKQEPPPYQSPPRPPPQQEPYQTQLPPPLHQQEPSQAPRRRGPVITYIPPRRVINTPNENFMPLVQRITGQPPTSTAPPYTSAAPNYTTPAAAFDDSQAMAELERTKPRLGFAGGGVETTDHQNQQPNLSPRTSALCRELTSTFSPQELEFLNSLFSSPPPTSAIPHCDGGALKRPRFDLGHDNVSRDEDRGIPHSVNDTRTIGSHYDMSRRRVQTPSLPSGRVNGVGGMARPGGDNLYMPGRGRVFPPHFGPRAIGFGLQDLAGRPSRELLLRLPPDASNTLFVEGLPLGCSLREVAHIFRPFSGYKEVRLVTKDSKHRNGDPVVLCFVDFENPACAATARNELQGYRMDEEEPDSKMLHIQFSRNPGPRPGQRGGRK